MDNKKLMIIDGSSLLHRAFYALPLLSTKNGIYTNGVYGFLTMLYRVKEEYNPDYFCVAFDKKGPTFRHKEYKEYKGTRKTTPSELGQQFPIIREVLDAMNIKRLELDEYEADDIAGTLAKMGDEKNLNTILVTGDKDYLQLVTDKTQVLFTRKGISELEIFDPEKIREDYGIEPTQFIDLKGLMGDQSDNIPGVPGIGEKTGLKLIKEFATIENIYKNIDKISGKKLKENLIENESIAYMSRRLGEIITNINLGLEIEDLAVTDPNWEALLSLYEDFELKTLINRLPIEYREKEEEIKELESKLIDIKELKELVEKIKSKKKFAFKFMIKDSNVIEDDILALGIKTQNSPNYYIDLKDKGEEVSNILKPLFEDEKIEKIGHNLKTDIIILFRLGIKIQNYSFDSQIAGYIIDPSENDYSINKLSNSYLGYYGLDEEMLLGKGKKRLDFSQLEEKQRIAYIAFILDTVYKLEEPMNEKIKEQEMESLYYEMELPLVEVLSSMEYFGVEIDKDELTSLGQEYQIEIDSLTKEIHELAGSDFNINSPKQMGNVLFEDLGLPVIKKTKTGYSTNVEVLEELMDQHEIIPKIFRYRQIVKLKSTYIDGFINVINEKTGRIHSSFNQTITTTGRISSTEPNLQNIPIRTEDGRKIRKAFIAKLPDYKLVDADYSQIELRVLAHISNDENMIEAFANDEDIHTKTASQVFHVPLDEVTGTLRSNAKAVNFGIVYGISDYGLSRDLNISRNEAKEYIDNYLENYKGVRQFMVDIVAEAKKQGYVETIFKRRRYIKELEAKNFNIRSFGERIAMNTPIQGSAADIIKIAMVRVYNEIKKRKLKSRLILQIHDELIIETHEDEKEEVLIMLKEIMEAAAQLKIALKVDIEIGESWYDTH